MPDNITRRDPDELAREMRGLPSNDAFRVWRDACDAAEAECEGNALPPREVMADDGRRDTASPPRSVQGGAGEAQGAVATVRHAAIAALVQHTAAPGRGAVHSQPRSSCEVACGSGEQGVANSH